ncbi:hypothetical protein HPB49_000595 [Dermacentor silvarum]|uniref:Uncharacterized protein n=1 Tax=Dermacentor silvarum TaxID=543639 RepID=A0ACB8DME4_DERSI|nr:hypothetical protein HPB49_000595 [Dermacentor silvarum]
MKGETLRSLFRGVIFVTDWATTLAVMRSAGIPWDSTASTTRSMIQRWSAGSEVIQMTASQFPAFVLSFRNPSGASHLGLPSDKTTLTRGFHSPPVWCILATTWNRQSFSTSVSTRSGCSWSKMRRKESSQS